MISKAWYKPSSIPKLLAKFQPQQATDKVSRSIEVWTTTCIVTNFGMGRNRIRNSEFQTDNNFSQLSRCSMLINPANPFLTGPHSFPYFPKGGPQPETPPNRTAHHIMGYVTQWGGMDVGNGMLFPAAVIDGLVHQLGGMQLLNECTLIPKHPCLNVYHNQQSSTILSESHQSKCPVGTAVITSAGDKELRYEYDSIIHTVPPFYKYPPSITEELKGLLGINAELLDAESWSYELLLSCYRHSFHLAFGRRKSNQSQGIMESVLGSIGFGKPQLSKPENQRLAVPLLGAGCRGFPTSVAINAAAKESISWLNTDIDDNAGMQSNIDPTEERVIAFGLLESSDAEELVSRISESL